MSHRDVNKDPFDDIYQPKSNAHRRGRKAKPPSNGKAKPYVVHRPGEKPNVPARLPVEVLEVIFGLLAQSSLRKGTSLVCKEWHRVTEQFISRKGTWKVSGMDYQDDLLERIRVGSVNTLECWFMLDPDVPGVQSRLVQTKHHAPMWDDFVRKITSPLSHEDMRSYPGTLSKLSKAANTGDTMPPCLLHLIREIHFHGYDLSHPQHGIVSLIPNLVAIHTLSIHDQDARYTSFPLTEILRHCPRLERISIQGSRNSQVFIDLLLSEAQLLATENSTKSTPTGLSEKKQPYRLIELTLRHVSIPVWILERLLGECPHLQVLIAEDMNGGVHGALDTPSYREPLHLKELYASAAKLCPQLRRIHLSHSTEPSVNVDMCVAENKETETLLRSSFPKIREIAYIPGQGALDAVFSNLVYLEILIERIWPDFTNIDQEFFDSALQKMPHLLHLHALAVPYRVGNVMMLTKHVRTESRHIMGIKLPMDYSHLKKKKFRKCDPINKNPPVTTTEPDLPPWTPPANNWACTRLQTLSLTPVWQGIHVDFFYHRILSSFVHLTDLTLSQPSLLMGQLLSPSEDAHRFGKPGAKARSASLPPPLPPSSLKDYHASVQKAFEQRMAETKAGKRAENLLWALLPLRVLESLTLTVDTIPGVLFAQDFEFLRRTPPHLWTRLKIHFEVEECTCYDYDRGWYDEEIDRPPEVVFWPKLGSFRVLYRESPAQGFLYEPLLAQVEQEIRPAVDFRFQRVFSPRPQVS
ncbi:hypothetical protein BGZ81_008515 [Podila clonocystis]|nr:hypothetical protein BGZ81_008515 [Podila clonocystis]